MWIPLVCIILQYRSSGDTKKLKAYQLRFYSLICLVLIGLGLSIFLMIKLFGSDSFRVFTTNGHITYRFWITSEHDLYATTVAYLLCTIIPFFLVQRIQFVWFIGASVGAAAIATWLLYIAAFPSTWCFFAAWLSMESVGIKVYDVYRRNQIGMPSQIGDRLPVKYTNRSYPSDNRSVEMADSSHC